MDFKDISEEAGMLLINIIEHEKESNYWLNDLAICR